MKNFIELFNKVGGKNILRQYLNSHVLLFAFIETAIIGFSKKSLEIVRLAVNNKVLKKLRKKYHSFILAYKNDNNNLVNLHRTHSNKVWVCWLQGIENAPDLVQKCYRSLKQNIKEREVILLTEDNYRNFIQFPDYIQQKIDNGIITKTHMSDLLRLELLIRYGGTWIDATVFCSGSNYPEYFFNSDLFVFQCLKPGLDGHCTSISSWFMTACTNHPILLLTKEMLYDYWKTHNKMMDYFLLHDFFQLAIEAYPEEWNQVVPFSNSTPHILLLRLFEQYDEKIWKAIKSQTAFHKLTYKFKKEHTELSETFYNVLFNIQIGKDKMDIRY